MKKIKTLSILVFLTLFIANSYAQKNKGELKCKFDVEKKDAFSGNEYKSVKLLLIDAQGKGMNATKTQYVFEFFKDGNSFSVKLGYALNNLVKDIVPKDNELLIKLSDNEILKLYSTVETLPIVTVGTYMSYTTYTIPFTITSDDLAKISNAPPTNWKLVFGSQSIQHDIDLKYGTKFSDICKCLLK